MDFHPTPDVSPTENGVDKAASCQGNDVTLTGQDIQEYRTMIKNALNDGFETLDMDNKWKTLDNLSRIRETLTECRRTIQIDEMMYQVTDAIMQRIDAMDVRSSVSKRRKRSATKPDADIKATIDVGNGHQMTDTLPHDDGEEREVMTQPPHREVDANDVNEVNSENRIEKNETTAFSLTSNDPESPLQYSLPILYEDNIGETSSSETQSDEIFNSQVVVQRGPWKPEELANEFYQSTEEQPMYLKMQQCEIVLWSSPAEPASYYPMKHQVLNLMYQEIFTLHLDDQSDERNFVELSTTLWNCTDIFTNFFEIIDCG